MQRIVIVGGALAGQTAVSELMALGYSGELVWITDKPGAYSKPALSKEFMQDRVKEADILLPTLPKSENAPKIVTGNAAIGLDGDRRQLRLENDKTLEFDGLIIATGANARMPAIFRRSGNAFPLRTLDDARCIREHIANASRAIVIGGGLIGCEMAASLRGRDIEVKLVESLPTLMDRPFGGAMGDYFTDLHQRHGVDVLTGSTVTALVENEDGGSTLTLVDGSSHDTELIVVGTGSVPANEWLAGCGLHDPAGIPCNAYLETSLPHVYACGDVASWANPLFDCRMRVEHWTNASAQGRNAARNLFMELENRPDEKQPFADVPYFWSDQYGLKFQMVGWHPGHDRFEIRHDEGAAGPLVTYFKQDRIVAAAGVNASRTIMKYRRQIADAASTLQPCL